MEAIKRAGGYVSFDPNIRSDLWRDPQDLRDCLDRALALADAIKLSEEELAFISGSDDIVSGIARLNARFSRRYCWWRGKAVQAALRERGLATSCPPGGGRSIPPAPAMPLSPGYSPTSPPTVSRTTSQP